MESEIGFPVEQGPFPCKTRKFGLGHGCGRSANSILVLMTDMRLNFCSNIWSTKRSRLMSNEGTLISWSYAMWSGTGTLRWSWFPR